MAAATEMGASFLNSCCRVCLTQEHIMVYMYDKVDEYDMTLAELLATCGNLKIDSSDIFSKLICTDCTEELLLVAKFRDKCKTSEETLSQFAETMETSELEDELSKNALIISEERIGPNEENEPFDIYIEECENDSNEVGMVKPEEEIQQDQEELSEIVVQVLNDSEDQNCSEENSENNINETDLAECGEGNDFAPGFDVDGCSIETKEDLMESSHVIDYHEIEEIGVVEKATTLKNNCSFCGAAFTHLNNLHRHMLTHKEDNKLMECETCTMMFTCPIKYHTHMMSAHIPETITDDRPSSPQPTPSPAKPNPDSPTTKTKAKSKRRPRKQNPPQTIHECSHCSRTFPSNSLLLTHVRTHTGERPFNCWLCEKTFTTRGGLDLHMRRHLGVKPFQCKVCHKSFSESSNLRVHSRTHTGEKPHQCGQCLRSFTRVFLLQIHLRTHTGERPFPCTECDRAFAQQGDLAAHRRIHTGERPHKCQLCGKGFIKSSALTTHMRSHARKGTLTETDDGDGEAETESIKDDLIEYDPLSED